MRQTHFYLEIKAKNCYWKAMKKCESRSNGKKFSPKDLLSADALLGSWRSRRTELAALSIFYASIYLLGLLAIFYWSLNFPPLLVGVAGVASLGALASLAAARYQLVNHHYAWIPLYVTIWLASSVLVYETGGLTSPAFSDSLLRCFLLGIVLQATLRPSFFFGFAALNFLAWSAVGPLPSSLSATLGPWPLDWMLLQHGLGNGIAVYLLFRQEAPLAQEVARASEELTQTQVRLARAVEANDAKVAFLNAVSHEVRTPLTLILGFLDLFTEGSVTAEEKARYVRIIKENGERLAARFNDILEYADSRAKTIGIERAAVELRPLLASVVEESRLAAEKKGLSLSLKVESEVPNVVITDEKVLRRIVGHLLDNAVKFTSKGGARVLASLESSPVANEKRLKISVKDSGIGIPKERVSELFKPFAQLNSKLNREIGGSGLGLALVFDLSMLAGGTLRLEWSEPGCGSEFALRLPQDLPV